MLRRTERGYADPHTQSLYGAYCAGYLARMDAEAVSYGYLRTDDIED